MHYYVKTKIIYGVRLRLITSPLVQVFGVVYKPMDQTSLVVGTLDMLSLPDPCLIDGLGIIIIIWETIIAWIQFQPVVSEEAQTTLTNSPWNRSRSEVEQV